MNTVRSVPVLVFPLLQSFLTVDKIFHSLILVTCHKFGHLKSYNLQQVQDEFEVEMIEEEMTDEDFLGRMVNKSAIIVKAKQPLFDWLNKVAPGDDGLSSKDSGSNIYLIDEIDDTPELDRWLKTNYERLFLLELYDWHVIEEDYPKNITLKLFKEWFDYELNPGLVDLGEDFIRTY